MHTWSLPSGRVLPQLLCREFLVHFVFLVSVTCSACCCVEVPVQTVLLTELGASDAGVVFRARTDGQVAGVPVSRTAAWACV